MVVVVVVLGVVVNLFVMGLHSMLTISILCCVSRELLVCQLKKPDLALRVCQRGIKMLPWSVALWTRLIRVLERTGATPEVVEQAATKALETGMMGAECTLEILMAHLDYSRRRVVVDPTTFDQLRAAFDYAEGLVSSLYPEWEAAAVNLGIYRARVEPDVETARQVWERLVRSPLGRYIKLWVEYVRWCRSVGKGVVEARGVLKRALTVRGIDYHESVCELWLDMEREEGSSLDDFEDALARVTFAREKARQVYAEYEQPHHHQHHAPQQHQHQQENANGGGGGGSGKGGRKRPAEEGGDGMLHEEEGNKKKARVEEADSGEDTTGRRVFVKHLCTTLSQNDVVEEMVRLFGPVKSVKLKTAKDGTSRGMADVVFTTEEGAQAAVGK